MRKSFSLLHRDGSEWVFERHGGTMRVLDANDAVVDTFIHEDAITRFETPSFWRSVKFIVFKTTRGHTIEFQPDKKDVRIVKEYLDDALMYHGIDAIVSYRLRGVLALVAGLALFFGCGVGAYLVDEWARTGADDRRGIRLFLVGMVGGVITFVWGLTATLRATRLIGRWNDEAEDDAESDDDEDDQR